MGCTLDDWMLIECLLVAHWLLIVCSLDLHWIDKHPLTNKLALDAHHLSIESALLELTLR